MGEIKLLDKKVSELVAAGEVVERPASVIKELVENCADAGATAVTVEIKKGGLTYMRVADNGCGIPTQEVQTAFLRHATSKISRAEDLERIMTMGFRGEALASICSVSKTEIITKCPGSEVGYMAQVYGGDFLDCHETGCPDGTTVLVRDLFYNVPARLKFLKKDMAEGNAVTSVVQKAALANPKISVRYIRDGREILYTPGNGRLFSAVYSVYGKELCADMAKAEYTLGGVSVYGYVSKPYAGQATRANQNFFVNGRYVQSRTCMAAIEQAAKNLAASNKFLACVMNISVPFELVDINIHPAKTEVRFADEKSVFEAVYYAVKSALGIKESTPEFDGRDFGMLYSAPPQTPTIPASTRTETLPRTPSEPLPEKPLEPPAAREEYIEPYAEKPADLIETKPEPQPLEFVAPPEPQSPESTAPQTDINQEHRIIGEVFGSYIIVQRKNELYIIDKHAAHERILFERLKKADQGVDRQGLLQPMTVILAQRERTALAENGETLERIGFLTEDFDDRVIVREVPEYIEEKDIEFLLSDIARQLAVSKGRAQNEILDGILHTAACKGAIKAGKSNDPRDLEQIVTEVLDNPDIRYCPHGRPVLITMDKYGLDKKFKRV